MRKIVQLSGALPRELSIGALPEPRWGSAQTPYYPIHRQFLYPPLLVGEKQYRLWEGFVGLVRVESGVKKRLSDGWWKC